MLGLYRDNGKENGNNYDGLYRHYHKDPTPSFLANQS